MHESNVTYIKQLLREQIQNQGEPKTCVICKDLHVVPIIVMLHDTVLVPDYIVDV